MLDCYLTSWDDLPDLVEHIHKLKNDVHKKPFLWSTQTYFSKGQCGQFAKGNLKSDLKTGLARIVF
jgi:hypothetical protein